MAKNRKFIYETVDRLIVSHGLNVNPKKEISRYIIGMDLAMAAAKISHAENPVGNQADVRDCILKAILFGVAALQEFGLPPES